MNQADASNDGTKIPIVVLHQKGMKYADCLTFIRLRDMMELRKRIEELEAKIQ